LEEISFKILKGPFFFFTSSLVFYYFPSKKGKKQEDSWRTLSLHLAFIT